MSHGKGEISVSEIREQLRLRKRQAKPPEIPVNQSCNVGTNSQTNNSQSAKSDNNQNGSNSQTKDSQSAKSDNNQNGSNSQAKDSQSAKSNNNQNGSKSKTKDSQSEKSDNNQNGSNSQAKDSQSAKSNNNQNASNSKTKDSQSAKSNNNQNGSNSKTKDSQSAKSNNNQNGSNSQAKDSQSAKSDNNQNGSNSKTKDSQSVKSNNNQNGSNSQTKDSQSAKSNNNQNGSNSQAKDRQSAKSNNNQNGSNSQAKDRQSAKSNNNQNGSNSQAKDSQSAKSNKNQNGSNSKTNDSQSVKSNSNQNGQLQNLGNSSSADINKDTQTLECTTSQPNSTDNNTACVFYLRPYQEGYNNIGIYDPRQQFGNYSSQVGIPFNDQQIYQQHGYGNFNPTQSSGSNTWEYSQNQNVQQTTTYSYASGYPASYNYAYSQKYYTYQTQTQTQTQYQYQYQYQYLNQNQNQNSSQNQNLNQNYNGYQGWPRQAPNQAGFYRPQSLDTTYGQVPTSSSVTWNGSQQTNLREDTSKQNQFSNNSANDSKIRNYDDPKAASSNSNKISNEELGSVNKTQNRSRNRSHSREKSRRRSSSRTRHGRTSYSQRRSRSLSPARLRRSPPRDRYGYRGERRDRSISPVHRRDRDGRSSDRKDYSDSSKSGTDRKKLIEKWRLNNCSDQDEMNKRLEALFHMKPDEIMAEENKVWIRSAPATCYYERDTENPGKMLATDRLKSLCDTFKYELLDRGKRLRESQDLPIPPPVKPRQRLCRHKNHEGSTEHDSDASDCNEEEDMNDLMNELERKQRHPYRLHPELWYNDPGEMNDGPLCRCSAKARRSGIRHGFYAGEDTVYNCEPMSNNAGKLYHYRITISPPTNFLTRCPTIINYDDHEFIFEGFSLISHYPIGKLPVCKVIRFNIEYIILYIEEKCPENFCIEEVDLFYNYLFKEILELVDFDLHSPSRKEGCPQFHFMPRFVRELPDNGRELLPMCEVLNFMLRSNVKLFEDNTLDDIHKMSKSDWQNFADSVKGMIVTNPGMKPSSIRVDQIDRETDEWLKKQREKDRRSRRGGRRSPSRGNRSDDSRGRRSPPRGNRADDSRRKRSPTRGNRADDSRRKRSPAHGNRSDDSRGKRSPRGNRSDSGDRRTPPRSRDDKLDDSRNRKSPSTCRGNRSDDSRKSEDGKGFKNRRGRRGRRGRRAPSVEISSQKKPESSRGPTSPTEPSSHEKSVTPNRDRNTSNQDKNMPNKDKNSPNKGRKSPKKGEKRRNGSNDSNKNTAGYGESSKAADKSKKDSDDVFYPDIVHFGIRPPQLSYAGNPEYQKAWRKYVKLRHLIANMAKPTSDDKQKLAAKESNLHAMRAHNKMKRDVTVTVSSQGFYLTGLMCDIVQHAMLIPILVCHLRFHRSLHVLENTIQYKFKDKFLLQLALTHPSYRENFGTNSDHARNSLTNCGIRQPKYGDKRIHYMNTRKRGINTLINIMSRFGRKSETQSNIYHNERLEFLGDAVVEFITSTHLFHIFRDLEEGGLATYRAALVQNQHLAVLAKKLNLDAFMLYAHGSDLCHDLELKHAMANCFEALMGALFLDGGVEAPDKVLARVLYDDDADCLDVWSNYPQHILQEQEPMGDRKWIPHFPFLQKLTEFEKATGIEFTHIRLLARAFTDRSVGFTNLTLGSNQRLEFLGDSVLQLISSEYLYKYFPEHHEGHLSLLRSSLVNNKTQSVVCDDLGMTNYAIYANPKVELKVKDRADLLEAFLGALFVDNGLDVCRVFCDVCFFPRLQLFIMNQDWNDPKSKLQQCCLTLRTMDNTEPDIPVYKVVECKGPTNTRVYTVAVYFRNKRLAKATGHSIQQAEMNAAQKAMEDSGSLFPQLDHQKRVIAKSMRNQKWPSTSWTDNGEDSHRSRSDRDRGGDYESD